MRHNKKINHLGRTHSHREAMLSNMAVSLIKHKRIFTTLAKAKELRKYVEPLITKSKEDTTHSRRVVFQNLRDKYAVTELFADISQKIGERPGGYTRIIKTGNRLGDNASMCFIELVDYNELMLKDKKAPAKAKTRRSRKKSDAATDNVPVPKAAAPAKKTAIETPPVEKTAKDKKAVKETAEVKEVVATEEVKEVAATVEVQEEAAKEEAQEIAEVVEVQEAVETEPVEQVVSETEIEETPTSETPETEETK